MNKRNILQNVARKVRFRATYRFLFLIQMESNILTAMEIQTTVIKQQPLQQQHQKVHFH